MNQFSQPGSWPANASDKSRQNVTIFCPLCRWIGHTLKYCRSKAHDDEIKTQQTRNSQELWTVLTHECNKRRGPKFGFQNTQNFTQHYRYGNQNNQKFHFRNCFNPGRNRNWDRQYHRVRSSNSWTKGSNSRQQIQYNFNARPENSDAQYNRKMLENNNLSTPNTVQFLDDHDANSISDQIRQRTSHTLRFEEQSYDFLCYKFYLQDIEDQNLKLKTERNKPLAEDHTEDTKPLIEIQSPINHTKTAFPNTTSVSSTPVLNVENLGENEESLEGSFDEGEETNTTHTEEMDYSDFRADESIILNSLQSETTSENCLEDPIEKNLHLPFLSRSQNLKIPLRKLVVTETLLLKNTPTTQK